MSDLSPRLRPGASAAPRCPHPTAPWLLWLGPSPAVGPGTGSVLSPAGAGALVWAAALPCCSARSVPRGGSGTRVPKRGGRAGSMLQTVQDIGAPGSRPHLKEGTCWRLQECGAGALGRDWQAPFPVFSWQHRQGQLLSPPAKVVLPMVEGACCHQPWKTVGSACLEIAVLGGFLTVSSAQGTSSQRPVVF